MNPRMTGRRIRGEGRSVKKLLSLFHLSFLPSSGPVALLVLRVWIGLSMLLLHGVGKAQNLGADVRGFPDPLGIGAQASHALTVFGEAAASILLIIGAFTRFAALTGIITMGVAFFMVKKAALGGPQSGELAYLYLGCYVVLFIAGPGRFSLDQRGGTPS
jgi:putative oxidoreductase